MWTCLNIQKEHIFYDAAQQGYYFENRNVGYCFWYTKEDVEKFIKHMEFPYDVFPSEV